MRLFEDFLDIEPIENNIQNDAPKVNIRSRQGKPSLERHEYLMAVAIETTKLISMTPAQFDDYKKHSINQTLILLSKTPEISSFSGITFASSNSYFRQQFPGQTVDETHFGEMGITMNFSFDVSWKKPERIVRFLSSLYAAVMHAKDNKEDDYMCIFYAKNRAGDTGIVSEGQYYYMYTHDRLGYFLGKRSAFSEFFRMPYFFIPELKTYYAVENMLGTNNDEALMAWLLRRLAGSDDSRPKKVPLRKSLEKIIDTNSINKCPAPEMRKANYYLFDARFTPSANFSVVTQEEYAKISEYLRQPSLTGKWIMKMTNNRHYVHFIAVLNPVEEITVYNALISISAKTDTVEEIKTFIETINTLLETKLPVQDASGIIFDAIKK